MLAYDALKVKWLTFTDDRNSTNAPFNAVIVGFSAKNIRLMSFAILQTVIDEMSKARPTPVAEDWLFMNLIMKLPKFDVASSALISLTASAANATFVVRVIASFMLTIMAIVMEVIVAANADLIVEQVIVVMKVSC